MDIYLIVLIILVVAAVIDLMVGVANDAVNFLNSALGAKVAPRYIIMSVATAGILAGVMFSSGLMEVARKGIFNPEFLTLPEVMFIFAAVMLTDVLLLDFFNTFGMPTSTTVSLVFELLGAAVAIAVIKTIDAGDAFMEVFKYINTASVFKIIFSIVASVVIAFIAGSIIQYFSRMLFTFDVGKNLKRYGAVWGGVALAVISSFILIKGAKGASFLTAEDAEWIKSNIWTLVLYMILGWTVILQLISWFSKINILKPIVLFGTFALAMAFAANDLVNFIGAPMGGLAAYQSLQPGVDPWTQTMGSLTEKVQADTWILLVAGMIMATTLWLNKKSRTVTATSVNLGRQYEGAERFESIAPARSIVRIVLAVFKFFSMITPDVVKRKIESRFDLTEYKPELDENGEAPAFDMLRAAVNLLVAAMLISFGTSLKLPLSTTYVTFMVAMATALPDRAWGRESAVYRISGVLTVVGGWFFTAFMASTVAAIIATIIYFAGLAGIIAVASLAAYLLIRNHLLHRRREKQFAQQEKDLLGDVKDVEEAMSTLMQSFGSIIDISGEIVDVTNRGMITENRVLLREARENSKSLDKRSKAMSASILNASKLESSEEDVEEKTYSEAMRSLQLLMRSLKNLTHQTYAHVDNNHHGLDEIQVTDLKTISAETIKLLRSISDRFQKKNFSNIEQLDEALKDLRKIIRKSDKQQLKRSKKEKHNTRTSLLYFEILSEYQEILFHARALLTLCGGCSASSKEGDLSNEQAAENEKP